MFRKNACPLHGCDRRHATSVLTMRHGFEGSDTVRTCTGEPQFLLEQGPEEDDTPEPRHGAHTRSGGRPELCGYALPVVLVLRVFSHVAAEQRGVSLFVLEGSTLQ